MDRPKQDTRKRKKTAKDVEPEYLGTIEPPVETMETDQQDKPMESNDGGEPAIPQSSANIVDSQEHLVEEEDEPEGETQTSQAADLRHTEPEIGENSAPVVNDEMTADDSVPKTPDGSVSLHQQSTSTPPAPVKKTKVNSQSSSQTHTQKSQLK
ncbi:unnamed protein product [Arabidopsis thaliana]|uniref:(thale cress) hypothetical protein n=1 Tax=Arabidopsis thaliana TaxID=3702 RepID=A0A7G2FB57_ARATH|nr:unnamed protein product [Arabidopsis thaliana]